MNLHTEKEHIIQSQHFAYKLRELYKKDRCLFNQVNDYIPFSIHVNKKDSFDIVYANNQLLNRGKEMEQLAEIGGSYLPKISCPILFKEAVEKARNFTQINDNSAVCSHLQSIKVRGEMTLFYSNKLILNNNLFFNVSSFTSEMGKFGKLFSTIFKSIYKNQTSWLQFQSLTKREKEILKLLANGKSNKEVGNLLFISAHSVHTHRRNIYKKLDINKTSELVRFSIALDILS